jgi:AcrR family transcriptional regulator
MAERGSTTRQRLLRAATQLITEVGWGAVTTRKLAARAGVRSGVVHYHFSSVADLLIEAAVQSSREALAAPMAALASAPDVDAGLDRLLAAIDTIAADDDTALLLSESALAATRHELLRTRLCALLSEFRTELAAWLRSHGAGTDAEGTATALAAALDGLLLHRAIDRGLPMETVRQPLRRLLRTTPITNGEESR